MNSYLNFIEAHPKKIIAFVVMMISALTFGAVHLKVATDLRIYFSEGSAQIQSLKEMEDIFGTDNRLVLYIAPKSKNVFTDKNLLLIAELTDESWSIPYSTRVMSIQNYQYTYAIDDEVVVEPLYELPALAVSDATSIIRSRVFESEPLVSHVINDDGSVAAIDISIVFPDGDLTASKEAVVYAREMLGRFRIKYPDVDLRISGVTLESVALTETVQNEVRVLLGSCFAVVLVMLYFLLKRFSWMLLTLTVISLAVSGTIGLFGWLNGVISPVTGFAPGVVMIIAVADSVHILYSYFVQLRSGLDKADAIKAAMKINISPVFITSLTTIIGMLCLNYNESPPYQDLGNLIAFGTLLAYAVSMSLLPAALFLLPVKEGDFTQVRSSSNALLHFSLWTIRHKSSLLVLSVVVTVFFVYACTLNQFSDSTHEYHKKSTKVRQTLDLINDNLTGTNSVQYMLGVKGDSVVDPSYLKEVDAFGEWLVKQEEVAHVTSIADAIKRLNQTANQNDPTQNRIPDTKSEASQYLLLYEMSLPMGLGTDHLISMDRLTSRVIVSLYQMDSRSLIAFELKAQNWLAQNTHYLDASKGTGLQMSFAVIADRILISLVKGGALAIILVSVVLMIALRSVRYGLISLLPNILPALIAYGIWGMYDGKIGTATAFVFCMSLGIVIDDTVHFITKYLHGKERLGGNVEEGIKYAFQSIGGALIITSAVLIAGFSILTMSSFNPSANTGFLLSLTIAVALIVDFLFLPPLLMFFDKNSNNDELEEASVDSAKVLHEGHGRYASGVTMKETPADV